MGFTFFCCLLFAILPSNAFHRVSTIELKQNQNNLQYTSIPRTSASVQYALNVLDYGAKGDGTTDDTASFKSAFDAATGQGGAIIFAPTGTYLFNGQLMIPSGVSLIGSYLNVPSHSFPKTVRDHFIL